MIVKINGLPAGSIADAYQRHVPTYTCDHENVVAYAICKTDTTLYQNVFSKSEITDMWYRWATELTLVSKDIAEATVVTSLWVVDKSVDMLTEGVVGKCLLLIKSLS